MADAPNQGIIDPQAKAELVRLCVDGVYQLLKTKDRTEEDGATYAYQVWHAACDLINTDQALRDRLSEVYDPEVNYDYTEDVAGGKMPENPTDLIGRIKTAIAIDVATDYAFTSEDVMRLEAEREALGDAINP